MSSGSEGRHRMKPSDWWRPENLAQVERDFREHTPEQLNKSTDFGAYRMLLSGVDDESSGITLHNDTTPLDKVRAIAELLGPPTPHKILDAGCGAGFTTKALATVYPRATVLGVDLAEDAIAYATAHHPEARFLARSIAPSTGPLGEFDTIFCFEFYPFTRNTEVGFQVDFIRYFMSQLSANGRLVIYQTWKNENSLAKIFDEVKAATPEFDYRVITTPSPRLSARLPLRLAVWLSVLASRLGGRDWAKPMIIVTGRAS